MPWQNTMLGLFDAFMLIAPFDGKARAAARLVPATSRRRRVLPAHVRDADSFTFGSVMVNSFRVGQAPGSLGD
jgi:hypothetical protein